MCPSRYNANGAIEVRNRHAAITSRSDGCEIPNAMDEFCPDGASYAPLPTNAHGI
jgi:hypothetical protein